MRLLAAVVAKNAVGSSWRKTVALREYSRLPEAEKAAVRALALELLFAEPSPRVATQLSLLVTNIARYGWETSDTACKAVGEDVSPMEGLGVKMLSLVSPSTALAASHPISACFLAQCKHYEMQMHKQSYASAGHSCAAFEVREQCPGLVSAATGPDVSYYSMPFCSVKVL